MSQRLDISQAFKQAYLYVFFTSTERVALALTGVVIRISEQTVPGSIYIEVCQQFSEAEITKLLMTIVTSNSWNRLAIAAEIVPGSYTNPTAAGEEP